MWKPYKGKVFNCTSQHENNRVVEDDLLLKESSFHGNLRNIVSLGLKIAKIIHSYLFHLWLKV